MLLFCNLIQRLKSSKPYSTVFLSEVFSVLFDNLTYKERNLVNCFLLTWFLFTHLALTVVINR